MPPEPTNSSAAVAAPLQAVSAGGLRWLVRADVPVAPLQPALEKPDDYLARRDRQFKSSQVVTVARVPDFAPPLRQLVLRRLNYGKFKHRLRDWLRPTRTRRAFAMGLRLEQAGVATPRAVAVAEKRLLGWPLSAYLITEEVAGAQTLAKYMAQHHTLPAATVRQLADLIAWLHQQGFSHRDLKSPNVLLDDHQRPWIIDLDGVRYYGAITERRAQSDLIRLARGLANYPEFLRTSGWIFLRRYCARRGYSPYRFAGAIADAIRPEGDWTALRGTGNSIYGFARTFWVHAFESANLRKAEDFFSVTGEALSKPGLGTRYRARLKLLRNETLETVYLKRFGREKISAKVRRRCEHGEWITPGELEKRIGNSLRIAGLPVAEPLAWGWRRIENGEQHSFVVLSAVPGESLEQWAANPQSKSFDQKREMARRLAHLARRFHEQGWRHRDFYLCHIFTGDVTGRELAIIDLQRVFRPRWRPKRWRIKDVAQLNYSAAKFFSRSLRMYFLHRYLRTAKLTTDQKEWLRRVLQKSESIARHDRK